MLSDLTCSLQNAHYRKTSTIVAFNQQILDALKAQINRKGNKIHMGLLTKIDYRYLKRIDYTKHKLEM